MAEVLSQPPVQLPEALSPPVLVSSDSERSASSSPEPAPSSPEPAEKTVSPTQVTLDILPTTPDGKTGGTGTGTDSGVGSLDASPTEEKPSGPSLTTAASSVSPMPAVGPAGDSSSPVIAATPTSPATIVPETIPSEVTITANGMTAKTSNGPDEVVPAEGITSCQPDVPVKLRVRDTGVQAIKPISIPTMLYNTTTRIPNHTAMAQKRDGKWVKWTYQQYYSEVRKAAKSMIALGLECYHGVGIIGFNSPEWFIANLATIFAGGLATGIYTTNSPEACEYVAENCQANIIVVENTAQLAKVLKIWAHLPHLKAVVQYNGELKERKENVYTWSEFMDAGKSVTDELLQERIRGLAPNKCSTLIYTSGTTGNPKGVMLSHDNITWTANMAGRAANLTFSEDHLISYLPLSHVAAQVVDLYGPILYGATVWFAQPDALKGSLATTLKEVRPTAFLGVPRVWEKFQEKLLSIGAKSGAIKKKLGAWAKDVGLRGNLSLMEGQLKGKKKRGAVPFGWTVANAVVFKRIRAAMGLDRCKLCISAAAPITRDTLTYFMSLNIPVTEIYGMSESTGPHTVSFPWKYRLGSCGYDMPGCTTRLENQDAEGNGEICMGGRHVFMGYLNNEEKTREAVDEWGWLHSGDIGRVDDKGFMYITGRIKELIITAGGENVAPVPIEDIIKEECPAISNCMLIGDKRKFLAMLITLKTEADPDTLEPKDQLSEPALNWCRSIGSDVTSVSQITGAKAETVHKAIQASIDRANKRAESNAKRVAKWTILPKDFSVPGGELGPTLKLKRPVVMKMYAETIENFYA